MVAVGGSVAAAEAGGDTPDRHIEGRRSKPRQNSPQAPKLTFENAEIRGRFGAEPGGTFEEQAMRG